MADQKFTEKDVEKLNKAFADSNDEVKNLYDQLKDVFDVSKQITNQYDKTYKSLNKAKNELGDISKEIVKQEAKYKEILSNLQQWQGELTDLTSSQVEELTALEEINKLNLDKTSEMQKQVKEQEIINKLENHGIKNEGAILANKKAIVDNLQQQQGMSGKLKRVEAEMNEMQLKAIRDGADLADEYNALMLKREFYQKRINNLSEVGNKYNADALNLEQRKSILEGNISNAKDRLDAAKKNLEVIKKGEIIQERLAMIEGQISNTRSKIVKGRADEFESARELSKLGEKRLELEKEISNLTSKLNFWKLVQMGYERFVKLDEAAEKFRRETGFSNTQMVELRKNAESVNIELQEFGVGIEQAYSAAKALTDVFGHTSLVTKEAMTNVALMNANLNVAVEDSAAVLATFQGLGGATQEAAMNMMKIGAGLSEKAGVPFSLVMKDIANASETTTAMLGANPSKLMKSAIAARALGTDMNKIVASQRKLLDYSSSMNDELELSALLGKSVSFQLSRQLAYEGDIAGAAKATLETVKAAGDFDKMSVYQREALAKASGMELKDLTKMMAVDKQREEIMLGGDQAAKDKLKLQDETLKKLEEENDLSKQGLLADGEKAIRQQKMQGQMTKMKNIMESLMVSIGDVLEPIITSLSTVVVPIFKIVAAVLKVTIIPLMKLMAFPLQEVGKLLQLGSDTLNKFGDGIDGVKGKFNDFFKFFDDGIGYLIKLAAGGGLLYMLFAGKMGFGKIMDMVKAPFGMVKDVGKNMLGKLTGKGAASDFIGPKLPDASAAGDGVGKAAKATKDVKSGTGVKDFLTNLASGLKEMGSVKVLFGAFNLIPASIGLIAMIPGFFGAKLLEQIDGKSLKSAMGGLADGLEKMGTGSVAKGALVMILAGVGFAAMTVGAIGLGAVALLGTAAGLGLVGLSVGLAALSGAGLGVLVLLGVSLAFVGIAYAIKLASEAFINIAKILPEILVPLMQFAIVSPLLYIAAGSIGALALSFGMLAAMTMPALVAAAAVYIIAKSVDKLGDSFEKTAKGISLFSKTSLSIINPIKQLATANLKEAATGISSLGSALSDFGTGSAVAGIGSFIGNFLGGDPIAKMEKLASIGDKLKITADSISAIAQATSQFRAIDVFAESVTKLATSLGKLNDELGKIKSEELSKLSQISSASGTTSTSTSEESKSMKVDNSGIEAKLDKLTDLLVGGAIRVYMDGADVSSVIARDTN